MAIEKINFSYPRGTIQSIFEGDATTALELAAMTSHKVDECVDLVNGVQLIASEATAIVDEMKEAQDQFLTDNADTRSQLISDNQAFIDTLETAKTEFQVSLNQSKTAFETAMTNDLNSFKTETSESKTEFETTLTGELNAFKTDLNNSKSSFETGLTQDKNNFINALTQEKNDFVTQFDELITQEQEHINAIPAKVTTEVGIKINALVDDGTIESLINENIYLDLKEQLNGLQVNIMQYGAVPNDATKALINANAIQTAIDYVYNRGGGSVLIPEGKLFFVKPDIITLKTNVTLTGYNASLKIPDNIGDYWTLITLATNNKNIKVLGLTIDMNDSKVQNPSANIRLLPAIACHATIYGGGISNCLIKDNRILNSAGIQTILIDGYHTNSNCQIIDNYMHWVRGNGNSDDVGKGWYDNTMVYLNGYTKTRIIGNTFESDYLSRCNNVIDTNGKDIKISGNTTIKMPHIMDIDLNTDGLEISNNYFYDVVDGIKFWYDNFSNVSIFGNMFYYNPEIYKANNPSVWDDFFRGCVLFLVKGKQDFSNIRIYDNSFTNVATSYVSGGSTSSHAIAVIPIVAGIPQPTFRGLFIENNTFSKFNGFVILFDTTESGSINGSVVGNKFIDCGKLQSGALIYVRIKTVGNSLLIQSNEVYASVENYGAFFEIGNLVAGNPDVKLMDNKLFIKNGSGSLMGVAIEDNFSNNTKLVGLNSKVYNYSTGDKLSVYTGDIVIKPDGIYKITRYGTYGTVTELYASGTLNSYSTINVSGVNISQLKAGDVITVAGNEANRWIIGKIDYNAKTITFNWLSGSAVANVSNALISLVPPTEVSILPVVEP